MNDRTRRLLRKGLDQGYVGITEETRSPRGKLRLDEMTKRQTPLRGVAICEVDERTPDVLHNRILRETLLRLAVCTAVDKALRREILLTATRMRDVSRVPLTSGLFHRVQLSRNTAQYGLLMQICELVFHALMPDIHGKGSSFLSILDDEIRMAALFEKFLRKFYDKELLKCRAASEVLSWDATAERVTDLAHLPIMRTDISIRSPGSLFIVDAKYYQDLMAKSQYGERIRSAHLYQLTAYLAHARLREPNTKLSGMLLYPATGQNIDLSYTLLGTPVKIATVDLSMEWREIHQRLVKLINFSEPFATLTS